MLIKLTNQEIYAKAQSLMDFSLNSMSLPIKISFFLQRNKNIIIELGKEIEQSRLDIAQQYGGIRDENNNYTIPEEYRNAVFNEIKNLYEIEQEVDLHIFSLEELQDLSISWDALEAISFMIQEKEEDDNDTISAFNG